MYSWGLTLISVWLKLKGLKTKISKQTSSDADGFFVFSDLDADTYIITALKSGYKMVKQTITLEVGESTEIEIVMKKTGKRITLIDQ